MRPQHAKEVVAYFYKRPEKYTPEEVQEAHQLLGRSVVDEQMARYTEGRAAFVERGTATTEEPRERTPEMPDLDQIRRETTQRVKKAKQDAQGVRKAAKRGPKK